MERKLMVLVAVFVGLATASSGCKPDVGACPSCYEPRVVALFDPTQAVMPMPNDLVVSDGLVKIPTTFTLPDGRTVPLHTEAMAEFIETYLNTLDGFLPETPITFEFYSPQPDTLKVDDGTVAEAFLVFDVTEVAKALKEGSDFPEYSDQWKVTGLEFGPLKEIKSVTGTRLWRITVNNPARWQAGHIYMAFLKTDVKDSKGNPVAPSYLFNFLKSKEPLVTDKGLSKIPASDEEAGQLERIRQGLKPFLDYFEEKVPDSVKVKRSQIAIAWTFRVTSATQIVFDPKAHAIPTPNDLLLEQLHNEAALQTFLPQGADCSKPESIEALDPSSQIQASFFCWLAAQDGFSPTSIASADFTGPIDWATVGENVVVLDISGGLLEKVTTVSVKPSQSKAGVKVFPSPMFTPGHRYAVVFLDGLAGEGGVRIAPSPAMALLKLETPLYDVKKDEKGNPVLDDKGEPILSSTLPDLLSDEEAAQLEAVRASLKPLLDGLEKIGYSREHIVGLFTFTISSANEVLFDPAAGVIPFPNDLLLRDPTDPSKGLNLPVSEEDPPAKQAVVAGLNTLDGFSPLGPITIHFSRPIDPMSVKLLEGLSLQDVNVGIADITDVDPNNPATLANIRILGPKAITVQAPPSKLVFTAASGHPLEPGRRYMVVLFKGLQSAPTESGKRPNLEVSPTFFLVRSPYPLARKVDCPEGYELGDSCYKSNLPQALSDSDAALLEQVRLAYRPIFDALGLLGKPREEVVLFFTFRTLSVIDEMKALTQVLSEPQKRPLLVGGDLLPVEDPQVKKAFGSNPTEGIGYVCLDCAMRGFVLLSEPDLSNPDAPVLGHFQYKDGSPVFRPDQKFPFVLVLPEGQGPFPVVIFQHGLGGDRKSLFKVASSLAKKGLASIAIDAPYHGDHPLRIPNTPSGTGFFSADVFAVRDNIREAVLDQYQLTRFVKEVADGFVKAELNIEATSPGVLDTEKVAYLGVSLGGIIGAVSAAANEDLLRVSLVVAGGHLMKIFTDTKNQGFQEPLLQALGALGIEKDSPEFYEFISFAQWGLDRADPVNFGRYTALPGLPTDKRFQIVMAKGDDFIPNSTTEELASAISLADGSSLGILSFPTGEGTLCHGFFLDGCDPQHYPDLDQKVVEGARLEALEAVSDFLSLF